MKKHVSDFLELVQRIYIDACAKCSADVSDFRDLITIRSRAKDEGLSFLTITLPKFASDLERALESRRVDATLFTRWKRAKGAVMPAFLQGITRHIFDFETGEVISNEDIPYTTGDLSNDISTFVESVRQICLTFKKVELECAPKRVQAAFENFIAIERSFDEFFISDEETAYFRSVSCVLWDSMLSSYDATACIPRHGPGATAESISGNRKYRWKYWYDRLEPYFPIVDNGYPLGIPESAREFEELSIVPEGQEQPVKVVAVPKTLKGPRTIAIEPCCMQYVQQGVRDYLYDRLETHWLTVGHVNFRDQSINQRLAIGSSADGRLATIDLSDASDRVPLSLVEVMLHGNQDFLDSVKACRSGTARLPSGEIISLRKFASMGSALCFPIEAMYFYTVCVVALLRSHNLAISPSNIYFVTRDLYVYGDDIVVPSTNADVVLEHLRKYNCKVNTNKTFVSGSFRESCGVDAYSGYEVTPTYLRRLRPLDEQQAASIVSWVATANLFYRKGYWHTASFMRKCVEEIVGNLPYVRETCSGLGHFSYLGYESIGRWNSHLQRLEVQTLVPKPIHRTDALDGYGALMKCFLAMATDRDKQPSNDDSSSLSEPLLERSLKHSALRGAVSLKRRWVPTH